MPRPNSVQLKQRYHVSGPAVVSFSCKDHYPGEHSSPKSYARYASFLAIYTEDGCRMPADVPTHQIETPITVGQVVDEWKEHVKDRSALVRYRPVSDVVDQRTNPRRLVHLQTWRQR